jgi:hypothetical protein
VPALAPLLGVAGLAPAFVGVAGLASTPWRRAGLACAGLLWLLAAEVLSGHSLLFGVPDGVLARAGWEDSVSAAGGDALGPVLASPALAPLALWAAFAAVLPVLVRGRFLLLDLVGASVWAAGLAAAHTGLGDVLASTTALGEARGGIAGSLLAAALAVALTAVGAPLVEPRAEPATVTQQLL